MVAAVKKGAKSAKGNQEVRREVFSVEGFCDAHDITKPTFYELLKNGQAPRIMRVGRRVLISVEDAAAWRKARAAATEQAVRHD